jgi:hypothetical protein
VAEHAGIRPLLAPAPRLRFLLVEEGDIGYPFWVPFGLGVYAYSFLAGVLFLGRESGRVSKLVDSRGAADPEVERRIRRILLVSRFELLLLVLVIVDMTIKAFGQGAVRRSRPSRGRGRRWSRAPSASWPP